MKTSAILAGVIALCLGAHAAKASEQWQVYFQIGEPCYEGPGAHPDGLISNTKLQLYEFGCDLLSPWSPNAIAGPVFAPVVCTDFHEEFDQLDNRDGPFARTRHDTASYSVLADGRYEIRVEGPNAEPVHAIGFPCSFKPPA